MTLNVGDKAPEFSLPASTGETLSLKGLAGEKVALYFYPKDDTPGCTKEACGFRDADAQLKAAGIQVVGASADSLGSHERLVGKYGLPFPLLPDGEKTVASAYGAWGEKKGSRPYRHRHKAHDLPHRRGGKPPADLDHGKDRRPCPGGAGGGCRGVVKDGRPDQG